MSHGSLPSGRLVSNQLLLLPGFCFSHLDTAEMILTVDTELPSSSLTLIVQDKYAYSTVVGTMISTNLGHSRVAQHVRDPNLSPFFKLVYKVCCQHLSV